ncbi:hypothetical protein [Psychromicrobium xiongbiense]|uniref:hypothetical protein n=1 Tax=Psychromicrobium xiongbiense TaxID=3051184 RepID=UPI0025561EDE|nr:hypothetical protein [Psychromicrobium sp. YIM S02556]
MTIDKSVVTVGEDTVLTVTGHGFKAGEVVSGTVHSVPMDLGVQTADANGQVVFTFNSKDLEVGAHSVTLTSTTDATRTGTVGFTVIPVAATASASSSAAATGTGDGSLPDTGANGVLPLLAGGAVILLLGAVMIGAAASRKRRKITAER